MEKQIEVAQTFVKQPILTTLQKQRTFSIPGIFSRQLKDHNFLEEDIFTGSKFSFNCSLSKVEATISSSFLTVTTKTASLCNQDADAAVKTTSALEILILILSDNFIISL